MDTRQAAIDAVESQLAKERAAAADLERQLQESRAQLDARERERGDTERHERDLANTQSALERELAERQEAHDRLVSETQADYDSRLSELQTAHMSRLSEVESRRQQELSALRAERERDFAELEAAGRAEIAALSSEVESLRLQIAQAEGAMFGESQPPAIGGAGEDEQWQPVRLDTRYLFPEGTQGINQPGIVRALPTLSTSGCQVVGEANPQAERTRCRCSCLSRTASSSVPVWSCGRASSSGAGSRPPACRAGLRFSNTDDTAIEAFVIRYAIST